MKTDQFFEGTLVLDVCSRSRKIKEAVWNPTDQEPVRFEPCHHLGMYIDSVLIGNPWDAEDIDVRFYNHPSSIEFYSCNVEAIKITNHLPYTLSVRGLTEPADLEPYDTVTLRGTLIW